MAHISHLHQLETLNLQNNWLTTDGKHSNTIQISCRNRRYSGRTDYRPVVYKIVLCGTNGSVEFLLVLLSCGFLLTGSVGASNCFCNFSLISSYSAPGVLFSYSLLVFMKTKFSNSNTPNRGRGNAVSSLTPCTPSSNVQGMEDNRW